VKIEKNNSDNLLETKKQFCKKLENFKQYFEKEYPQNGIQKRLDFETVSEWKDGNKENSLDKRIDKLIKKCLEFKKKVFNIRGIKDRSRSRVLSIQVKELRYNYRRVEYAGWTQEGSINHRPWREG